ncbi:MAG: hypothetical protein JNK73_10495 [Bacteroidia bacterium]|nr:hypothetical protein [Bacteroidia bacterium]
MFSTGRIIFALVFLVAFVLALVWSYRKDSAVNRIHFKKPYKVLLALLGFFLLLFLLVKIKQYL